MPLENPISNNAPIVVSARFHLHSKRRNSVSIGANYGLLKVGKAKACYLSLVAELFSGRLRFHSIRDKVSTVYSNFIMAYGIVI